MERRGQEDTAQRRNLRNARASENFAALLADRAPCGKARDHRRIELVLLHLDARVQRLRRISGKHRHSRCAMISPVSIPAST